MMDSNFDPSPQLDDWHLFVMRPFGLLGLFFCYVLWNSSDVSLLAAFNVFFSASLPWYAQATKPVKTPEHFIPFLGTVVLALWSVAALATAAPKKKSN